MLSPTSSSRSSAQQPDVVAARASASRTASRGTPLVRWIPLSQLKEFGGIGVDDGVGVDDGEAVHALAQEVLQGGGQPLWTLTHDTNALPGNIHKARCRDARLWRTQGGSLAPSAARLGYYCLCLPCCRNRVQKRRLLRKRCSCGGNNGARIRINRQHHSYHRLSCERWSAVASGRSRRKPSADPA